ncbi:2-keto-4-pentenoate hydratase [Sphingopyxis sp. XHP0097]|uniref:2-keto-4-pentenoate hydratase n=1 Tax=Sphingopyxis jiangsuensis TaxID=2871171 RepID=A0ABS7MDX4_9SPHN|nr:MULTISPECIES: 2-keto-4-pentenoate hydratase [Sphingopyxis]MBL0769656.1 2-keto-4-pentenoate hydratase [Sphingopyxis lutea]MBY4637215.1 2-keto-4-pentenoate hydratase [Sphingopyxis jiangsuensis]
MAETLEIDKIAGALIDARALKTPLTLYPGPMPQTMAEAYAIQDAAIALDGRRIGGWKVGRIPDALVERFGENRLTGPIFDDEIFDGSAGSAPSMPVYSPGFAAAEAEVLLCFGEVGARDYDIDSVKDCIAQVRTGIEIASSPFPEINLHGPAVTASDYGNNKGLILGPAIPGWRDAELIRMPVEMFVDGQCVGAATMEAMLDGPFGSALFLIRTLRARGIAIPPGTWVSAGAITGIHEVKAGQTAHAVFNHDIRVNCSIRSI